MKDLDDIDMDKVDVESKKWIDNASYEALLCKWRHAPIGDPLMKCETGDYYCCIMSKRKCEMGSGEQVAISKRIGWS